MFVKKVTEYSYSYCDMIVSDSKNNIKCICVSVPLKSELPPREMMEVDMLYACIDDETKIKKIIDPSKKMYNIYHKLFGGFSYFLRGQIIDQEKALFKVYDLTISLEYLYDENNPCPYKRDEWIELTVNRIDAIVENYL